MQFFVQGTLNQYSGHYSAPYMPNRWQENLTGGQNVPKTGKIHDDDHFWISTFLWLFDQRKLEKFGRKVGTVATDVKIT